MADSTKRTECVKVCFDERTFIDLGRRAALEDRKLADLVYLIVKQDMYGRFALEALSTEGTDGD
jgi:hypothetical protein